MPSSAVLQMIQESQIGYQLSQEQVEKLAALASERNFAAGEIIFRENEVGNVLYIIGEGQVAIEIRVPGRGRSTILTVGPGQILGWSSLFPSERKTASARSVHPTKAVAIDATRLRETIEQDHDLGCLLLWRIAEIIAGRLKATRLQLLDIFEPAS
jgi:CRP-like cAMP-binding protein